ncbi:MAG: hypothetical protein M1553_07850 [Firmicutes bacterium]|nr:hypothetical protein [Bacillota bacterium]
MVPRKRAVVVNVVARSCWVMTLLAALSRTMMMPVFAMRSQVAMPLSVVTGAAVLLLTWPGVTTMGVMGMKPVVAAHHTHLLS